MVEVMGIGMNGVDLFVFDDFGCGESGTMSRSNTGIGWGWECNIGGGYRNVLGVLDYDTEVSEGSVTLYCGSLYYFFVNIVL